MIQHWKDLKEVDESEEDDDSEEEEGCEEEGGEGYSMNEGNEDDETRPKKWYDATLREIRRGVASSMVFMVVDLHGVDAEASWIAELNQEEWELLDLVRAINILDYYGLN